jgi:hypothetical protein
MPVAEEVRQAIEVFDQSQGARDRLSQWERDFMTDQQKRWEEYGEDTRFSVKQIAVVEKIYKKMMGLT